MIFCVIFLRGLPRGVVLAWSSSSFAGPPHRIVSDCRGGRFAAADRPSSTRTRRPARTPPRPDHLGRRSSRRGCRAARRRRTPPFRSWRSPVRPGRSSSSRPLPCVTTARIIVRSALRLGRRERLGLRGRLGPLHQIGEHGTAAGYRTDHGRHGQRGGQHLALARSSRRLRLVRCRCVAPNRSTTRSRRRSRSRVPRSSRPPAARRGRSCRVAR